ncbi:family 20 glycosylhydrolase [Staphylococcus gallinarum]|uniref:family 20 glycosylhydrolase n=1 Tax=Staphylococcus gallinarum TaxID=1293 RepID=UPI002DB8F587|nr:family 20 glycosylhydrolase [Staphylococcus gallinarum]MEB7040076.1 family 20 glycosylhydrolase [Staphylococcus gallinarum]
MKMLYKVIVLFSIFTYFFSSTVHAEENSISKGVTIDIARKYHSLSTLKKIVKEISDYKGSYLQLHFSDDSNYAIASKNLGQTSSQKNNQYLTENEVKSLIEYSNQLGIEVVPDFDVPSHSKAWLNLIKQKDNTIYSKIINKDDPTTIDYENNKTSLKVVKEQLKEIALMFQQPSIDNQNFVLGADEVYGGHHNQKKLILFINELGEYLNSNNYKASIWNDSVTQEGLSLLNKNISFLYWKQSESGSGSNGITVEDIEESNHKVLNYNFYILYFLPSPNISDDDLKEQLKYFDSHYNMHGYDYINNNNYIYRSPNHNGVSLTFWGEKAESMTQTELLKQELPLIKSFLQHK